jgi:hypothetical protein
MVLRLSSLCRKLRFSQKLWTTSAMNWIANFFVAVRLSILYLFPALL